VLDGGTNTLVHPCGDPKRPDEPTRLPDGLTLALTFSGGGFRATLSALGVIRYLADSGLLERVRYVSSVSGGSIANAMLACNWGSLRGEGFSTPAVEALVIDPIVASISTSSLKGSLARNLWRAVGPTTRTDLLARDLDRRFFGGRLLESLDPQCRWIFNASNLTTGVRFAFERDMLGDYAVGLTATAGTGVRVSTAVAASAAVPGAFAPLHLRGIPFPCGSLGDPFLLDGGAYDNTGITALEGDGYKSLFFVSLNAGGVFRTGRPLLSRVPFIGPVKRAEDILYRQSTVLRTEWMVERFQAYERAPRGSSPEGRRGVLFALSSTVTPPSNWTFPEERQWDGRDLAFVPTSFNRFPLALCRRLVHRGWWLTGATIATYHPDLRQDVPAAPPAP
jgi:NTE family protein